MLKRNFIKSIKIDFKAKGYKFLYQFHTVFGVFTLLFVLIICLTGLYWSYGWCKSIFYTLAGVEKPKIVKVQKQELSAITPQELQNIRYSKRDRTAAVTL
jgi:sulfite reductase (NADPH) flavoprotein alpha-component